jgi:hypothetical protein
MLAMVNSAGDFRLKKTSISSCEGSPFDQNSFDDQTKDTGE